jgi:RNA polymerase sigma-70 factor (ECF subfamily)
VNDDAALVQRCLAGDEAGRRALVEQYQGIVFAVCYRMLGQREDAEDVSQDVFLRVFRSLHRWDSDRPLKPWLLTIAANRCRTALERRSRIPTPSEAAEHQACHDGQPQQNELAEELQLALATLRDDYRMCFVLFYEQELSCARIGEILGCPEGTVKTWLHRARKELAAHLERRGVSPWPQFAPEHAAG